MRGEGTKVLLRAESNLGYGADQVDSGMTLGALLEAVQTAVDEWGEDAEVVLFQTNNRYGANFGKLDQWQTFEAPETEECEECGTPLNDEGECLMNHDEEEVA